MVEKNMNFAFTIIAQNYLAYAMPLAKSMRATNPEVDFYIVFSDGVSEEVSALMHKMNFKYLDALSLDNSELFLKMAFYYEITEYCTAIKPFIFIELHSYGYAKGLYIDPDIYVYSSFGDSVFAHLENNSIFITPHICSPIDDVMLPNEDVHLKTGTYNLGFIGLSFDENSISFLNWWSIKCSNQCFNDSIRGLFVDQKWVNLVPGMFSGVYISRNLGLNLAYWNLHERVISVEESKVGEDKLVFIHFSGFVKKDIEIISKYQNRYSLKERDDLRRFFESYLEEVDVAEKEIHFKLPFYKFNYYSDGKYVSLLSRRFYFWNLDKFESPFIGKEAENVFLRELKKYGIKESSFNNSIFKSEEVNKKATIINYIMRLFMKFLGPNRYVSLLKYMGYLSSINNNRVVVMKDDRVINDNRRHLSR